MHRKFHRFDPYALDPCRSERIRQLGNSHEAAYNNNKIAIEDDESSDKALFQRNSQSSRAGRMIQRIRQLRNSQEAADNNNKMAIEDEESSDKAVCQRNSQSSIAGRMIIHKRLKVCTN